MASKRSISGFSKMSREQKINWLLENHAMAPGSRDVLDSHLHPDPELQERYGEFSENTISNFFIPFGLAPNFLVNGEYYTVPMAIEESSVVAAASHAAKFWSGHGGFHATVTGTVKVGQVHFLWTGAGDQLLKFFREIKPELIRRLHPLTESMEKRGGGIREIRLVNQTSSMKDYYQMHAEFYTADAMGANFINTVLEALASAWHSEVLTAVDQGRFEGQFEIIMSILSNYTPESLVSVYVESPFKALDGLDASLPGTAFAEKFVKAVQIAGTDTYRAVTHNKGIFNGMDAVVIATGNDFRAVEACGHAYASRGGKYRSLSTATADDGIFRFTLEVPMAVGTVGGLTKVHPMAARSLEILGNPGAEQLMMIIAAAGLANNFSAVRSLITSGIQAGHMKMHLTNILQQLGAGEQQKKDALEYFREKPVSFSAVKKFLEQ